MLLCFIHRTLLLTSTRSRCRWRTIQDVGAHGGSGLLGLGWAALELRGFRASFRDQPALIPGREHLGSVPGYPERRTPSRSPTRQELHQRMGDPEKGTGAVNLKNTTQAGHSKPARRGKTKLIKKQRKTKSFTLQFLVPYSSPFCLLNDF